MGACTMLIHAGTPRQKVTKATKSTKATKATKATKTANPSKTTIRTRKTSQAATTTTTHALTSTQTTLTTTQPTPTAAPGCNLKQTELNCDVDETVTPIQTTQHVRPISTPLSSSKTSMTVESESTTKITSNSTQSKGRASAHTGSVDSQTWSIAAPVVIVVVLVCVLLVVMCVVRRRRQKNDNITSNNDQNPECVANPAKSTVGTSDILSHPAKTVLRTPSFSQDSGYAECQDVDKPDANNSEYNTIIFKQDSLNVDQSYSHIQTTIIDNTYSHLLSEQNTPPADSNYSHIIMKLPHPILDVNDSIYNKLQANVIHKTPNHIPVTDQLSENEYNHANFGSLSLSTLDNNGTEYSHLNSSNKGVTREVPSQTNIECPKAAEYKEVDKHQHDINEDSAHTYFVLEKDDTSAEQDHGNNKSHTYFVLEEEMGTANENDNAKSESKSTSHDYFVLMKQSGSD